MLKFILSIVVLTFTTLQFNTAMAQNPLVLNISVPAPFHTNDGKGFVDVILKEVFERIDIEIKIVQLPAERALVNANSGIDDGEAHRIVGIEKIFPNLIPVPVTWPKMRFVAFTMGEDFPTDNWSQLNSRPVAFINGWKILEREITDNGQVTLARDANQLFDLLTHGRVEVVIYDAWLGLAHLQENNIQGVRILEPAFAERDLYMYLHKKHADLVPRVEKSFRAVKADGTYDRYFNQIFSRLVQKE